VVNAEGDGLDSNGYATMTGGTVVVNGPVSSGNGALDSNGGFLISGGTLLAAGSSGMAVSPDDDSEQGWFSATMPDTVSAGDTVQVLDSDGNLIVGYTAVKDFSSLVYSSPEITDGEEYQIVEGGSTSGASTGGMTTSGDTADASDLTTVTAGEAATGGGFGGGGGMGGRGDMPGAGSTATPTTESTDS